MWVCRAAQGKKRGGELSSAGLAGGAEIAE